MIYLDHAAGSPMHSTAVETWCRAQREFAANPSSLHEPGTRAAQLLELARKETAARLGAETEQLYFTAGGSEANQLALGSLLQGKEPGHVVTTTIEHPSAASFFRRLERNGTMVTRLVPDRSGVLTTEQLTRVLRPETALISIQLVNSETGIMQPVSALKQAAGDIPFHTDAVQAFGKVPLSINKLGVEAASVSAHKLGGPKHMGAVYLKDQTCWKEVWPDTTQEHGFRPGTVDVPGAAAFAAAVQAFPDLRAAAREALEKRRLFIRALRPAGAEVDEAQQQSPYIVGIRIPGMSGQYLLALLDRKGIYVSTGTACTQGETDASMMMQAMHPDSHAERSRFLRVSFTHTTTPEELIQAAEAICDIVEAVRRNEHVSKSTR
ncbi:cysteine desulfurase family protein [Alkalicoccus luteus]|uniref:Cysteine desulfurase n=1 Tax=Alkalicoccus luteus TaxID=1237094 RepID=A0A969TVC5_9BACI|nr:cysteine desulfurase family protein [Alkalicoccus luteus]NJP36219.1 cysteine desulfurase [Alkalicoccus luteus]